MSVSRAMSLLMLRQGVRPVRPALVASLFLHEISVPQSTSLFILSGNVSGKRNRASSRSLSRPSNPGGRAHGGTDRRRSSSVGCGSATLMRRMAISSVARRSLCARAALCHLLWLTFFCLVRVYVEVELGTSVTSRRTSRFVTSSETSRPVCHQAVYFPLSEEFNFL